MPLVLCNVCSAHLKRLVQIVLTLFVPLFATGQSKISAHCRHLAIDTQDPCIAQDVVVLEAIGKGCEPRPETERISASLCICYKYKENYNTYLHHLCMANCLQIWPHSFRADLVKMPPRHKDAS